MGSSKWCREEFSTAQERPALFEETKRGICRPFMVLSEDRCWLRVGCRAEQLAISASRRSSLTAGATALLPLGLVGSRFWQTLLCHWLAGYLEGYDELNRGCSLENAAWGGAEEGRQVRPCAQESYAPIWCWGWGTADAERLECRTERGKSIPRWTLWKQQEGGGNEFGLKHVISPGVTAKGH